MHLVCKVYVSMAKNQPSHCEFLCPPCRISSDDALSLLLKKTEAHLQRYIHSIYLHLITPVSLETTVSKTLRLGTLYSSLGGTKM